MHSVQLKGKEYELKYNNRALFELETVLDSGIGAWIQDDSKLSSIKFVSAAIWAGRLHAEPKLRLNQVINELDLKNFANYIETIASALIEALGYGEQVEDVDVDDVVNVGEDSKNV